MIEESPTGRSVLVTGAAGALGLAVVGSFLDAGWRVAAGVRPGGDGAARLASAFPGVGDERLHPTALDVTDAASTTAGAHEAAEALGGLGSAVALAGGYHAGRRIGEEDPAALAGLMALNAMSVLLTARAAAPHLLARGRGAFVAVSSRTAVRPWAGSAGYAGSKRAVVGIVEALAAEWQGTGVRASCVLPSMIDTAANRSAEPTADPSRWVSPTRIASVIRWLCSDEASVVSGASIPVYGDA